MVLEPLSLSAFFPAFAMARHCTGRGPADASRFLEARDRMPDNAGTSPNRD
jgi:hypothetical protein